jgi:hypothetical protein
MIGLEANSKNTNIVGGGGGMRDRTINKSKNDPQHKTKLLRDKDTELLAHPRIKKTETYFWQILNKYRVN